MILVFAATALEAAACFGSQPPGGGRSVAGHIVAEGEGFAVCTTGIGRGACEVSDAVVEALSPAVVLSIGVCGGLAPTLEIGELVVARHVDHEGHRPSPEQMSIYCDERLVEAALEAAGRAGVSASAGACLTVDEPAWGPAEKAALHSWKSHKVVEMESFWVGRAAMRQGLPFLAARTVSDAADHGLLDTGAMRPDGRLDPAAFQAWAAANPHLARELAAQAERARTALVNLSRFLSAYLPELVRLSHKAKQ